MRGVNVRHRHARDGLAGSQRLGRFDLQMAGAGGVMHDDSDRAAVFREARAPLGVGEPVRERSQSLCTLFQKEREVRRAGAGALRDESTGESVCHILVNLPVEISRGGRVALCDHNL